MVCRCCIEYFGAGDVLGNVHSALKTERVPGFRAGAEYDTFLTEKVKHKTKVYGKLKGVPKNKTWRTDNPISGMMG